MVEHLVAALASVSNAAVAAVEADNDVVSSAERSLLIKIGKAIKSPAVVSPIQSSRRQHVFDDHTSSPTAMASPSVARSVSSRVFGSIRSSFITLLSPQRRKNGPLGVMGDSADLSMTERISPRNGGDNKRARRSAVGGRPALTLNPLWGRCTLAEFAHFSVGDQFIMIIPNDHKNDNKNAISQRKAIRDRIVSTVAADLDDNIHSGRSTAPNRRLSDINKLQSARDHITAHHGIDRNKMVYIELRCTIHAYPHRDDFINNTMSTVDIERIFRQNEGLSIHLVDYHKLVVLIRWNELPHVQLWQTYYNDDHRPSLTIKSERGTDAYVHELINNFTTFKDDSRRMCELLFVHEQKKNNNLVSTNRKLETLKGTNAAHAQSLTNETIKRLFIDEMSDERLPTFVDHVDNLFRIAWEQHYSNFQPNTPLVDDDTMLSFYNLIENTFPTHFLSIQSLMFGRRHHEPARAQKKGNLRKRHILVHYFFCLIRERDYHHLMHWAMVSTIALHYRGADAKSYRQCVARGSTTDVHVALEKLDDIYKSTQPHRKSILSNQQIIINVLDNYNKFCSFSTQRSACSGIFHNAIVYSAIRAKEFKLPRGTTVVNILGETWRVLSSSLSDNYSVNTVCAEQVHKDAITDEFHASGIFCSITLPSIRWRILRMPGEHPATDITYTNQSIPSSLRMRVPSNLTDREFITGNRMWMADHFQHDGAYRTLGVREYTSLVNAANVMDDILSSAANVLSQDDDTIFSRSDISRVKCELFASHFAEPSMDFSSLVTNIRQFQKNCVEYFNEAYHSIGEYMLLPLCTKNEMHKDELFLAVMEMMEQFGFVHSDDSGDMKVVDKYPWRRVFQYGDVLTIQKLHQLDPSVMKQMTHIGKDQNAEKIYRLFTETTVRSHDFLHENIHRLQAIFKIYYPGFIGVCCSVIGTKRISIDPTKGRWRDHEIVATKIVQAMKLVRFHVFVSTRDSAETEVSNDLWDVGSEYRTYCQLLLDSPNEGTRYVARFIHMMDRWKDARHAVSVGDWAIMEVSAIDWMPVWGPLKKPLYQMETMRRIQTMYSLTTSELEYYRMNRFFRMHKNGNCMSLDDFCEKHNYAMKQCAPHPDIEVMRKKSLHLHAASRCSKYLFGYEGTSSSTAPDASDDVKALVTFFLRCNVFRDNDAECVLDRDMFRRHIRPASFDNCKERGKIDKKRQPEQTENERQLLNYLRCSEDALFDDDDDKPNEAELDGEDDDDIVEGFNDDAISVTSIISEDNAGESESTSNKAAAGSSTHAKLNKLGLKDLFSDGTKTFRAAVLKRLSKVSDAENWERTITNSVRYFQKQMECQMMLLREQRKMIRDQITREELPHEMVLRRTRLNGDIYSEALR